MKKHNYKHNDIGPTEINVCVFRDCNGTYIVHAISRLHSTFMESKSINKLIEDLLGPWAFIPGKVHGGIFFISLDEGRCCGAI